MHELAHPLIEVVSFCRTYFGNKLSTHDYLAWNWHDKRRRFVWYHSPFATIQHWWSWAITFDMALYNVQDLSTIVVVGLTLGILTNITFKQFSNAIFSWLEPQLAPQIMYHDWILIPVRNRAQPQPSLKHSMEEPIRKWILMHIHRIRRHQMLTWNTLNGKKSLEPTDSNYHYERKDTMWDSEAMTSSSMSSPTNGYNRKCFLFLLQQ